MRAYSPSDKMQAWCISYGKIRNYFDERLVMGLKTRLKMGTTVKASKDKGSKEQSWSFDYCDS